jgi:lipopolysaccharide transport system ATP-binding protein
MPIEFGGERHELPPGAVVGVVGDDGSGVHTLLDAAGGRCVRAGEQLDLSPAPLICIAYALDLRDAFTRHRIEAQLAPFRRSGGMVVLASHDAELLRRTADEIWWVEQGRITRKGDPREVLDAYARHTAERLRASAAGIQPPLAPAMRRGDGRARLVEVAVLDSRGEPAGTLLSGAEASIRVRVVYEAAVSEPVVGIMIRTRIGMEVYGTNTELEQVAVGPCTAGDTRTIIFRFSCHLCPGSYTLTAASHDPDGVWHDWLEDAITFSVAGTRYTAGVANLRAEVTCSRG